MHNNPAPLFLVFTSTTPLPRFLYCDGRAPEGAGATPKLGDPPPPSLHRAPCPSRPSPLLKSGCCDQSSSSCCPHSLLPHRHARALLHAARRLPVDTAPLYAATEPGSQRLDRVLLRAAQVAGWFTSWAAADHPSHFHGGQGVVRARLGLLGGSDMPNENREGHIHEWWGGVPNRYT